MNRKIRTRWCRLQHTSHTHTHTCQTNALASAAYSTPNNTFTHLSNKQTYWCGLQHTSHIKYTHTLFSAVGCSSISVGSSSRCCTTGGGCFASQGQQRRQHCRNVVVEYRVCHRGKLGQRMQVIHLRTSVYVGKAEIQHKGVCETAVNGTIARGGGCRW